MGANRGVDVSGSVAVDEDAGGIVVDNDGGSVAVDEDADDIVVDNFLCFVVDNKARVVDGAPETMLGPEAVVGGVG